MTNPQPDASDVRELQIDQQIIARLRAAEQNQGVQQHPVDQLARLLRSEVVDALMCECEPHVIAEAIGIVVQASAALSTPAIPKEAEGALDIFTGEVFERFVADHGDTLMVTTPNGKRLGFISARRIAAFAASLPGVDNAAMAAFGASDAACYLYPGEDQQAERAAFCAGAAHSVSLPGVEAKQDILADHPEPRHCNCGLPEYSEGDHHELCAYKPSNEPTSDNDQIVAMREVILRAVAAHKGDHTPSPTRFQKGWLSACVAIENAIRALPLPIEREG